MTRRRGNTCIKNASFANFLRKKSEQLQQKKKRIAVSGSSFSKPVVYKHLNSLQENSATGVVDEFSKNFHYFP